MAQLAVEPVAIEFKVEDVLTGYSMEVIYSSSDQETDFRDDKTRQAVAGEVCSCIEAKESLTSESEQEYFHILLSKCKWFISTKAVVIVERQTKTVLVNFHLVCQVCEILSLKVVIFIL